MQKLIHIELTEAREGWNTLSRAIPDGTAKAIANRLHVTADHVRRWRRKPFSDEAPLSNGQRSPLDRVCDLIDAVFLSNPVGAALIVEHVKDHYEQLLEVAENDQEWDRRRHAADLLREAAEGVNALNLECTPDETTLQELLETRTLIDQAITNIRSGRLASGAGTPGTPGSSRLEATEPIRSKPRMDRLQGGQNGQR